MDNDKRALGRAALLAAADALQTVAVDVPELGGTVRIREMGADERDEFDAFATRAAAEGNGRRGLIAFIIMLSVVDEDGVRQFGEADLPQLGRLPQRVAKKLETEINKLSFLAREEVEELAKNSEGDRNASSSSESPEAAAERA